MNYITQKDRLMLALTHIYELLVDGGIFVFDFYHGAGIQLDPPKEVVKNVSSDQLLLQRATFPSVNLEENLLTIHWDFEGNDSGKKLKFEETHFIRYFFMDEIKKWATDIGFDCCDFFRWMTYAPLSKEDWFGVVVLKK